MEQHRIELKSDTILRFKLRLNIESWGQYSKGDEDYFHIRLLDEQCGLTRFPIDKQWDIVSCELVTDEMLSIPDIRNKLSPISNMITMLDSSEFTYHPDNVTHNLIQSEMEQSKKSLEYLSGKLMDNPVYMTSRSGNKPYYMK